MMRALQPNLRGFLKPLQDSNMPSCILVIAWTFAFGSSPVQFPAFLLMAYEYTFMQCRY